MNTHELGAPEFEKLLSACRGLPDSNVQIEETDAAQNGILILMSTVLSLNRRWYSHALPARQYFERNMFRELQSKTLREFDGRIAHFTSEKDDTLALARTLWARNEWGKARILLELVNYFMEWVQSSTSAKGDMVALQLWARTINREDFLKRKIKGLGPRAYEQLLWYIDGQRAIKIDRHVQSFVNESVGRCLKDSEIEVLLKRIATILRLSPTTLDARIWDFMQRRSRTACHGNRKRAGMR
jgi:hypothetical protein